MTTAAKKHRLVDRLSELAAENAALKAEAGKVADSIQRGIHDATELADARAHIADLEATLTRIDGQHAQALADKDRQIAELRRRLDIAVKANAAAHETQGMDVATLPIPTAQPRHRPVVRLGASPLADTQPVPRFPAKKAA